MKTHLAAAVLTAALAQPAAAVTFPSLTTIYVGSGVTANGPVATSIHCSNVSGVSVQVRALILGNNGSAAASQTETLAHGATFTFSTQDTVLFADSPGDLEVISLVQGVENVEATNSAIFCTAVVVDADNLTPVFMSPLHLVRVNPHPGTVE